MKFCDTCRSSYPPEYNTCPRDQTVLRHTSELVPGLVLRGKYEILEKVGQGGMAAVYRARHLAFGEIRAIKVVGALLAGDEEFQKRFRTEAVVTRRLQHPHAVRVDDLDVTEDGRPFIVMEYVEGRSLRDLIRTESPVPLRRAATIARQVASALGAAHDLGITHRDIKPDNIVVTTDPGGQDHAKVLDFGIAKVREGTLGSGAGYTPTQTGMVVGTPQYMSPEQAMGKRGDEIDGRADLYALGIIVFEMVTGRLPFESDTPMGLILHHLQTPAPQAHQIRPDLGLPRALGAFLTTALAKDRERRFRNAAQMQAALAALAEGAATTSADLFDTLDTKELPATAARHDPPTRALRPAPTPPREPAPEASSRPALLASAFVVVLVLGAVAWHSQRPRALDARPSDAAAAAPTPPTGTNVEARGDNDGRIQNEIQRLVLSSTVLRDEAITVEVANGIVTLGGTSRSETSHMLAQSLAFSVPGVQRVFNTIVVHSDPGGAPAAAAPVAAPPAPSLAEAIPPPVPERGGGAREDEEAGALVEKGNRELSAGNPQAALASCQAALRIQGRFPPALGCVQRAKAMLGGPGSRRR